MDLQVQPETEVFEPNDRLCDYFIIAGAKLSEWRSQEGDQTEPSPKILTKFPPNDIAGFSLPEAVPIFCFPEGFSVRKVQDCPQFYVFVLTDEEGRRTYGSCLSFCEKLPSLPPKARRAAENSAARGHRRADSFSLSNSLFVPKVICIVSHWPFYSLYKHFLTHLYRISATTTRIPLERYVSHFMQEVPLPPPGVTQVAFRMGDMLLSCSRPPVNQLPLADIPMKHMFQCLDLNHVLMLFTAVLTERKILLHSNHSWLLNVVAESVLSLIFPFQWQHAYIPLLPVSLIDFIHAPTPFLMGCHTSSLDIDEIPEEVAVFDLDNNEVLPPDPPLPALPDHQRSKLWKSLRESADNFLPSHPELEMLDLAFVANPFTSRNLSVATVTSTSKRSSLRVTSNTTKILDTNEGPGSGGPRKGSTLRPPSPRQRTVSANVKSVEADNFDLPEVRDSFLRFFVSTLLKYQNYVNFEGTAIPDDDFQRRQSSVASFGFFDAGRFIQNEASSSRPFLTSFLYTNMFEAFIEERVSPEKDSFHLLFFDECIQAKLNRSRMTRKKMETPFLDERAWFHRDTHMCPPADASGLPEPSYKYNAFPEFQSSRYKVLKERPPSLVTPVMKDLKRFSKVLEDMQKLSVQALSKKRHRREYYALYLDSLEQPVPETPKGARTAARVGIAGSGQNGGASSPTGNSSDNESESRSQTHSPTNTPTLDRSSSFEHSPAASEFDSHGSNLSRRYTRTTTNLAALDEMKVRARAAKRAQTVSGRRPRGLVIPAVRELQPSKSPRPRDRRRYTLSSKYHGTTEGMDPRVDARKSRARSVGARPRELTAVLGICPFTGSTFTCECQCTCKEVIRTPSDRCEEVHCRAAELIATAWRRYIRPKHSAALKIQSAYRRRISDPSHPLYVSQVHLQVDGEADDEGTASGSGGKYGMIYRQESAPGRMRSNSYGAGRRPRPRSLPDDVETIMRRYTVGTSEYAAAAAVITANSGNAAGDGETGTGEEKASPSPPPLPPRRGRRTTVSSKPENGTSSRGGSVANGEVPPIPRTRKTVRACVVIQRAWRAHAAAVLSNGEIPAGRVLHTPIPIGRRSRAGMYRSKPSFGPNVPRSGPGKNQTGWALDPSGSAFTPPRESDARWIRDGHGFEQREYTEVDEAAARVIQHQARAWLKHRTHEQMRALCATRIQARFRAHQGRRAFVAKQRAARFIQAFYCMRVELRRIKEYRAAAVLVTAARRFVNRLKAGRVDSATLTLQSWWRGVRARAVYLQLRQMAVMVQSAWRMYVARKAYVRAVVLWRVDQKAKRLQAVELIQRVWRGFVVRRRYRDARHAVITLQAHWRRQIACRQFMTSTLPQVVCQLWSMLLSLWDSLLVPLTDRALFLVKFQRTDLRSMMALNRECNSLADAMSTSLDMKSRESALRKEREMLDQKLRTRVVSDRDTRALADMWGHDCDASLIAIRHLLCQTLFVSANTDECLRDAHLVQFLTDYTAGSVHELMSDLSLAAGEDLPRLQDGYHRWRVQAARCLQVWWRAHRIRFAREQSSRNDKAVTTLQAWFRGSPRRREYVDRRRKVIKLQALARGKRDRVNVRAQRVVSIGLKASLQAARSRIRAAKTLSHWWRHVLQARAVTVIARWWRGVRMRQRFIMLRRGIVRLQAIARARTASDEYQKKRGQIVACQKVARNFLSRKLYTREDGGARLKRAQAFIRGYLARRRLQRETIPQVLDFVVPAVAGLWRECSIPLQQRSQFVRTHSNNRLSDLHSYNTELARMTDLQSTRSNADRKRMQNEYKKEHKLAKKALENMDPDALTIIYEDWEIDPKGKQRKNKLLDAITSARDRALVNKAAALIQALLPVPVDSPPPKK